MRTEGTASIVRPPAVSPDGVLFLYAPNLGLRVRYGSLVIDLGRGRSLKIDRASEPRLRRLVVCGRGGWWTFEVPSWLRGVGASWLHLDLTGRILGSGPGDVSPDLPALRRQQAIAAGTETGIAIGRHLLSLKIQGQAAALASVPGTGETQGAMREHVALLAACTDPRELRMVEAQAAVMFWDALAEVPVRFLASDEATIQETWRSIGRRSSAVTGSPRGASLPAHAIWNFAYACAAGEVGIALRSTGLDPGISPTGLHADTPSRASATCDRLVLSTIGGRRFRRRDFAAQPDGRVRLTAPIAREVAEAVMPLSRQCVAPIAEELARTLARLADAPTTSLPVLPTNLTGDARSRGREGVRRGPRPRTQTEERIAQALLPPACIRCGIVLEGRVSRRRRYCDDCLMPIKANQVKTFAHSGPTALRELRAQGRGPNRRPEVRQKIGKSQSERRLLDLAWDAAHPEGVDRRAFDEIVAGLRALPLRAIAQATGLSIRAASYVRAGKAPHPRHWEALSGLARSAT